MSWEQLGAIVKEGRDEAAKARSEAPIACPRCGEPLQFNARVGVLFCRFDGYQVAGRPRE